MDFNTLLSAVCLVFVFEGILPFLSPPLWRRVAISISCLTDSQMRIMGLIMMLLGSALLYIIRE